MKQLLAAIVLLLSLWTVVLASLLGLLDVALSRYEDIGSRLLGLWIMTTTTVLSFGLALYLTRILTTHAYV